MPKLWANDSNLRRISKKRLTSISNNLILRDFIDGVTKHGKWGVLAIVLRCIFEFVALCSFPVIAASILLMLIALVS